MNLKQLHTVIVFFLSAVLLFSSCSLDYEVQEETRETYVPEMILSNTDFTRIINAVPEVTLSADQVELFTKENTIYASNVSFSALSPTGKISSSGRAALLFADNETDVYTLFGGVEIQNFTDDYVLRTENLCWNNNTEQVTVGKNDIVSIVRRSSKIASLQVQGSGFSASAFNLKYRFDGAVSGVIIAEDE